LKRKREGEGDKKRTPRLFFKKERSRLNAIPTPAVKSAANKENAESDLESTKEEGGGTKEEALNNKEEY